MKKAITLLAIVLVAQIAIATAVQAADKPNIILIMADDVGIEAFSSYGGLDYKTPNIDKIGENGVRFTHCYAQPLCTPSRVQIMTGRYNHRNYVDFGILDPKEISFGTLMKDAGYTTAITGKWQLGRKRELIKHFGFDEYLLWQINNRSERYNNVGVLVHNGEILPGGKGEYGPDLMADFALDFMTRHKDKPFFLYYPMMLVHDPFVSTPDTQDEERKKLDEKAIKKLSNDKRKRVAKANFVDMVHYMDKIVGRINDHLDTLGIRDNTIIMFTGDNGTNQGITSDTTTGPIRGAKTNSKDAGTHVPFVASWPGKGIKGLVTDELVDFTDFLPTILEAGGGKMPTDRIMDGVSFLPVLKGKKRAKRDWIYSSYFHKYNKLRYDFIRNQRWKLYNDGRYYDMSNDRDEKNPIKNPEGEALKIRDWLASEMAVVSKTTREIPKHLYSGKQNTKKTKKTKKK